MGNKTNGVDDTTFLKLRRLYFIALSAIALSIFLGQIFIRNYLNDQQGDATVINVAGRQRMLSQKLTKEILLLTQEPDVERKTIIKNQLEETLQLWETSHNKLKTDGLVNNNSETIQEMYGSITPYFESIKKASRSIISQLEGESQSVLPLNNQDVATIKLNEKEFLFIMDAIVNQYNIEASKKVDRLRNLEMWLMFLTLGILLVEFVFIFLPSANFVKSTIQKLIKSEDKANRNAQEAYLLKEHNEDSIKELRKLTDLLDRTLLFARIKSDGSIIHFGEKFSKLFKPSKPVKEKNFFDVISLDKNEKDIISNILSSNNQQGWQGEVLSKTEDNYNIWLEMHVVPFMRTSSKKEYLIISSDVTKRKKAQLEIEKLSVERYEEKMAQQKVITSKIIENQEKEQNRIAKDIHDGIGQMLTGLKFNIESINPNDIDKTKSKVDHLKELTTNIIKGVRTATFNLTPPELGDFGIVPALTKLTKELNNYSIESIDFYNKTDFSTRLDSLTEINIYRIVQEAINNATKYAEATHIIVTLSHRDKILSVTIDDNGVGFDPDSLSKTRNSSGGLGMVFMKERVKYINGRLFLTSEPGKGTRITLNVPLDIIDNNT